MRRLPSSAVAAAVLLALAAGCSSAGATSPAETSSAPASGPTTTAPTTPEKPAADAAADLMGSADDDRPASLAVSVTGPQPGVPEVWTPDGPLAEECGLDPAATEYATLTIVFTDPTPVTKGRATSSNLRLDIATVGGRDVGVVVDTYNPSTYCDGTTVLPPQSELQSQNLSDEHQTMTVYVVARTSPDVPHPLQGVTVQLLDLRHHADGLDSGAWKWDVQRVTAGSTCPADPRSLCVPLG